MMDFMMGVFLSVVLWLVVETILLCIAGVFTAIFGRKSR